MGDSFIVRTEDDPGINESIQVTGLYKLIAEVNKMSLMENQIVRVGSLHL